VEREVRKQKEVGEVYIFYGREPREKRRRISFSFMGGRKKRKEGSSLLHSCNGRYRPSEKKEGLFTTHTKKKKKKIFLSTRGSKVFLYSGGEREKAYYRPIAEKRKGRKIIILKKRGLECGREKEDKGEAISWEKEKGRAYFVAPDGVLS